MSDFGKGLCYCLGLFLAHVEILPQTLKLYKEMRKKNPDLFDETSAVQLWFYGSTDHLFDLEVESGPNQEIRDRLKSLRDKTLHWRMPMESKPPTKDDAYWAIQEAKDLLRLIDQAHGVSVEQGAWE